MSRMDTITKTMNRAHRLVWALSGHRLLANPFGMPAVELHTTGRKSGQRRTVILTSPIHDDSKVVVVASKGGDDRHPDWYGNLVAQPDVEITIDGEDPPLPGPHGDPGGAGGDVAHRGEGLQGLRRLPDKTDREIPLVICERR